MRSFTWRSAAHLLFLFAAFPLRATANPSINVDVQAAFASPPFIIELLETAADEKPDVYFPILDRIAEGYFESSNTDKELYQRFLTLLKNDKLITDPESLSALKFALSIRNSAPRIQAHYQFYETSVQPSLDGLDCEVWMEIAGKQYCDLTMEKANAVLKNQDLLDVVPFDRVLGPEAQDVIVTVYADITSKEFQKVHRHSYDAAVKGSSRYRVRYKPAKKTEERPLVISGYGVELALKRTDYIVIDDRKKDEEVTEKEKHKGSSETSLEDDEVVDMKPLSRSEVTGLSMNAAQFAVASKNPMDTLLKMTQDFPKHSASLASRNASNEFIEEYQVNREQFLPAGLNVMWINGIQYDPRKVDAFSLLDHLKRERKLINQFRDMGLTAAEAITILSNKALMATHTQQENQRFDWRDEEEGGDVIIWLNDIEKDKRYQDWPTDLDSLFQRVYPGQLPTVRKDISNAIVPVDFSKSESAFLIVNTIQNIIKRKVPLRWGIVPVGLSPAAIDQAKVIYHLQESYGIVAIMGYLEKYLEDAAKVLKPEPGYFQQIIEARTLKENKEQLDLPAVIGHEDISSRLEKANSYLKRLGSFHDSAPIFVNGVPVKADAEWLQTLSQQVGSDIQIIQRGAFEGKYEEDEWLAGVLLNNSILRRNPIVIPASDKDVAVLNLPVLFKGLEDKINKLPKLSAAKAFPSWKGSQLMVIADFDTPEGVRLAANAALFRKEHENFQILFVHNNNATTTDKRRSSHAYVFYVAQQEIPGSLDDFAKGFNNLADSGDLDSGPRHPEFPQLPELVKSLRLEPGQSALLLNGRQVGPLPAGAELGVAELEMLYDYELKKRITPAQEALEEDGHIENIKDTTAAANFYSLIAAAQISEIPEGIFELPPMIRTRMFYNWQDKHTAIAIGDNSTSSINFVIALDPASETAQRWIPILKAMTELDGVSLKIYMNPQSMLEELPVKRFYRYVLDSAPSFNDDGSIAGGAARFNRIPAKALLNLGMDVPAAWLVASKESIHDLDNLKLSSLPANSRVDATYQLESILIEGHSRDVDAEGNVPKGAQLLLSTAKDPHFADTTIMANLGYFQFKANPGYYKIDLKAGPSREIFNLDSVGSLGYEARPEDNKTEVALLSFLGVTLYPRLSRKPGMEMEDVLEMDASKSSDMVKQGSKFVGNLLQKAGLSKGVTAKPHADINIFSVASGHLYERMLNIMMVSVMRHTNQTVKFWFIEQFLSPSFKSFVPIMAKEYGFEYEMVTYKWPHWLRSQKEKQREIWGYKILFLDVLFPLDLDKVIFVDADQIVRTDMANLNAVDLQGAPYGFTPMCDSRMEMEGYRFWKQGYWKNFLRGLPYHISALYVVDLKRFRQIAAGDRLRQQYHQLSADPNSLSNLDQDLPNNMQQVIPIHSLDQNWLWCETWCSDDSLKDAKTIDLCNNPETKEPKLERARRQVPEWTEYDDEIAELARRTKAGGDRPLGSVQEDELKDKDRPASETASSEKGRPSDKDEL
ncbi:hypothetical protein BT63DRAFT_385109 [Microthyrium microscopicum]|uniref:UDP-glucose:glycoprotein glucosyltransferase n=1 Tax=Microthyrium microscopicum TaxID=703497 RepID=A0A6A6UEW4_9PEZI|nr:hypothetical protein BT63DRAFT_385109 [Microthyrium microscopicum]